MNELKKETFSKLYNGFFLWLASRCNEVYGWSIGYSMATPHLLGIEFAYDLLEQYPENEDIHFHLYSLLFHNLKENALIHLDKAIEKNPEKYGFVAFSVGNDFYNKELYREAIDYLWKAIKYNPGEKEAYSLLGEIYVKQNKVNSAVKVLKIGLSLFPDEPLFLVIMGTSFLNNANFKKALNCFNKVSSGDSEFREVAFFKAGIAYMMTGDYKKAIEQWEKLISSYPDNLRGYYCLGFIHRLMNNNDKSHNYFKDCMKRAPEDKRKLISLKAGQR